MLQGLVCLLRDPDALIAHAERLIEGYGPASVLDAVTAPVMQAIPAPELPEVASREPCQSPQRRIVVSIMLKQKDIMDCLPLLASVLGNQYGVTVEIGGSEAIRTAKRFICRASLGF